MCSLEDGMALGLHEHRPVTLQQLLRKPSAAVCRLRAGHSLFVPASWFHLVVTRAPSFGLSNNLVTLGGYGAAVALLRRSDVPWAFDVERRALLQVFPLPATWGHSGTRDAVGLGYRGIRGAVGSGYRSNVHKRTLSPRPK
jgi:hypothetical protein